MKKTLNQILSGCLFALLLASTPAAADDTLRIGTEGAYPPFNQIGPDGELQGFDIDIAKALCKEMNRDCEFVTQDWDGIIPGLLANKYDAIIASMSITPERDKAVDFTGRYYSNKLRFLAKKSSNIKPTEASLKGKTVGAQRATISSQWLKENMGDILDIKLYDTQENAFLDLGSGRIDAVLADMLVAYEWLDSEEGSAYEFKGEAVYSGDKIAIAVQEGNDKLRKEFNKAIKAIRKDGTYAEINAKYFPFDIY
ncbi:MAG: ABC transporter substrate-binding protein [Halofilum sp. (in: g-proteobacteria)]|nr:ABC transporter substrate-binding protein [Halofilum sp. (in: g-proteobacteria)]